jgi:ABC-type ATPase involved in cell division
LLPELSVFANVALGAKIARRHPRDYTPDVRELLVWVGLGGRGADRISRLSESEKRRLCLARALVNRPELLLVDDPTLGLGEKAARGIMRLIEDVNEAGTPIIFATRDRGLAVSAGGLIYDMPAREAR